MKRNRMNARMLCLFACLALTLCLLVSCGASNVKNEGAMDMVAPSEPGASTPMGETTLGGAVGDKSQMGETLTGGEIATKIIRTAQITAETREFSSAVTAIENKVAELSGYVESSELRGLGETAEKKGNRSAVMTLRVPAERLDELIGAMGDTLNVTSSSTSAKDITGEYYDIEARLSVLETERQVLEDMLAKSSSVSNMITVESRLYDVIYEIESYRSMLKVYDGKVAYSTVTLNLYEVTDLTVVREENTFGARVKTAFRESWQNFSVFIKDLFIGLIYAIPLLIVLAVVAVPVILLLRRRIHRRKGRKLNPKKDESESEA